MSVSDPSSGRAFIWLITCVLFISIMAGGACLVAYMVLPESEIASWVGAGGNGGSVNLARNHDVNGACQSLKGGELNRASSIASHESEMRLSRSMA
ncbi:unnamed protein product [Lupinus luteus]|uniref:Uncharacterized protein n=1 Tax=Lupinus luteus TaxID=3873 RepID=A0AAV1Y9P7_LUPLU